MRGASGLEEKGARVVLQENAHKMQMTALENGCHIGEKVFDHGRTGEGEIAGSFYPQPAP